MPHTNLNFVTQNRYALHIGFLSSKFSLIFLLKVFFWLLQGYLHNNEKEKGERKESQILF